MNKVVFALALIVSYRLLLGSYCYVVSYNCFLPVLCVGLDVSTCQVIGQKDSEDGTPISRGDYLHIDQLEERFCVFCVDSVYCPIVYLTPSLLYIIRIFICPWHDIAFFVLNVP